MSRVLLPLVACLLALAASGAARGQGFDQNLLQPPLPAGDFGFAAFLAAGDLDGNGLTDLVARDLFPAGPGVHVLLATGAGAFALETAPAVVPAGKAGFTPLVADADDDGHLDLLGFAAQPAPQVTGVALGDGAGGFLAPLVSPAPATLESLVDVGDLDGDGTLDLVYATGVFGNGSVGWQRGDGAGLFAPPALLTAARHPGGLRVADLDDDGDADVAFVDRATAEPLSAAFVVALEVEAGAVSASLSQPCGVVPLDGPLALGDLDGDGDEDAVVVDEDGLARRLPGGPGATLRDAQPLAELGAPAWAALTPDLDRDGFDDLLAYTTLENLVALRAGPGGAAQGAPLALPTLGTPTDQVVLGEFDGDGLTDVAVTDVETIAVYLNGLGPFIDLGHALGGPSGTPSLAVSGSAAPGGSLTVAVAAPPGLPGLLFAGFGVANLPLGGGLLVPQPQFAASVGSGTLSGTWPTSAPVGTALYLQAWFSGAGLTLLASNAVEVVGG